MTEVKTGDIGSVLDATEPVDCEFLQHKITAHVYTAGAARLTKEERATLRSVNQAADETVEISDEENEQLTRDISEQIYNKNVDIARKILPLMINGWDFDGSPMELRGQPFPPTAENMSRCPDALVVEVALKAVDVWRRPTNGDLLPSGSPPEEQQEQNQAETSTL